MEMLVLENDTVICPSCWAEFDDRDLVDLGLWVHTRIPEGTCYSCGYHTSPGEEDGL